MNALDLQEKITAIIQLIVGCVTMVLFVINLGAWIVGFIANLTMNWWTIFFYLPDLLILMLILAAAAFALATGALFFDGTKKEVRLKLSFVYLIILGACIAASVIRVVFMVGPIVVDCIVKAAQNQPVNNWSVIGISIGVGGGVLIFGIIFFTVFLLLGLWQFFVLRTMRTSGFT